MPDMSPYAIQKKQQSRHRSRSYRASYIERISGLFENRRVPHVIKDAFSPPHPPVQPQENMNSTMHDKHISEPTTVAQSLPMNVAPSAFPTCMVFGLPTADNNNNNNSNKAQINTEDTTVAELKSSGGFHLSTRPLFSKEECAIIDLMAIQDRHNLPDYVYTEVFDWARKHFRNGFDFNTRTKSRKANLNWIKARMDPNKSLQPHTSIVKLPGSTTAAISCPVFDFAGQLLSLLADPNLMKWDNLQLNKHNPLSMYVPADGMLGDTHSGSVYRQKYNKCFPTTSTKSLLCPIIIYIDKTHIDTKGRFCLEPVVFTLSMFRERTRNQPQAWRHLGFVTDLSVARPFKPSKGSPGDNIRQYHAQLDNIFFSLRMVQKGLRHEMRDVTISIEGTQLTVDLLTPIYYIIGDGKSNDCLTGRYGSHSRGMSRHCRACDVSSVDLAKPESSCKPVNAHKMKGVHKRRDRAELKRLSQHDVSLAFFRLDFCDNTHGIWGSTPTDPMHLLSGLITYLLDTIVTNLSANDRKLIDRQAFKLKTDLRQHNLDKLPPIALNSGLTSYGNFTAKEVTGAAFMFCLLILQEDGWGLIWLAVEMNLAKVEDDASTTSTQPSLAATQNTTNMADVPLAGLNRAEDQMTVTTDHKNDNNHDHVSNTPHSTNDSRGSRRQQVLRCLESVLCFDAFLRKRQLWEYKHNNAGKQAMMVACRDLQRQILKTFPRHDGFGWAIPKFHEMKHFPSDVVRFGTARNFDAGPCEENHKALAKSHGRRAQKSHQRFAHNVADRVFATQVVAMAVQQKADNDLLQDLTVCRSLPPAKSLTVHNTTSYRVDISTDPPPVPCDIDNAIYQRTLLKWLYEHYHTRADTITCYTGVHTPNFTLCCHPNLKAHGMWNDWCIVRFPLVSTNGGRANTIDTVCRIETVVWRPNKHNHTSIISKRHSKKPTPEELDIIVSLTTELPPDNDMPASLLFTLRQYHPHRYARITVHDILDRTACFLGGGCWPENTATTTVAIVKELDQWSDAFCTTRFT